MLDNSKNSTACATENSDLFLDLGYDSLSFVYLLLEIENAFSIQFELLEMGSCQKADQLISLVERKTKENS